MTCLGHVNQPSVIFNLSDGALAAEVETGVRPDLESSCILPERAVPLDAALRADSGSEIVQGSSSATTPVSSNSSDYSLDEPFPDDVIREFVAKLLVRRLFAVLDPGRSSTNTEQTSPPARDLPSDGEQSTSTNTPRESTAANSTSSTAQHGENSSRTSSKRKERDRSGTGQDDHDDDELGRRKRPARSPPSTGATDTRRFACPFFKRDPRKFSNNRACSGQGFPNVWRMK